MNREEVKGLTIVICVLTTIFCIFLTIMLISTNYSTGKKNIELKNQVQEQSSLIKYLERKCIIGDNDE